MKKDFVVIAYHPPKYNKMGILIEESSREPVTHATDRISAYEIARKCNSKSCVRIATTLNKSRADAESLMLCRFGVEMLKPDLFTNEKQAA